MKSPYPRKFRNGEKLCFTLPATGVVPNDILIWVLKVAASAFSGQPRAFNMHNGPIQGFAHSLRAFFPKWQTQNWVSHMGLNHVSCRSRRRNICSDSRIPHDLINFSIPIWLVNYGVAILVHCHEAQGRIYPNMTKGYCPVHWGQTHESWRSEQTSNISICNECNQRERQWLIQSYITSDSIVIEWCRCKSENG